MEIRTIKSEMNTRASQWNELSEVLAFDSGNAKGKARIEIRLDSAYQGEAKISIWTGAGWQEVYTLLNPKGSYGYHVGSKELFAVDRSALLNVLEGVTE